MAPRAGVAQVKPVPRSSPACGREVQRTRIIPCLEGLPDESSVAIVCDELNVSMVNECEVYRDTLKRTLTSFIIRRQTLNVRNFTNGTRSCWGGKPLVSIPNVQGLFLGTSS